MNLRFALHLVPGGGRWKPDRLVPLSGLCQCRIMRRAMPLVLTFCAFGGNAWSAELPMSAQAFENYTTGQTVTYANRGGHAGQEAYLEGRRVQWADEDGFCSDGTWYQLGEMICFNYGEGAQPQCWWFYLEEYGLRAEFIDRSADSTLFETARDTKPLICEVPGTDL